MRGAATLGTASPGVRCRPDGAASRAARRAGSHPGSLPLARPERSSRRRPAHAGCRRQADGVTRAVELRRRQLPAPGATPPASQKSCTGNRIRPGPPGSGCAGYRHLARSPQPGAAGEAGGRRAETKFAKPRPIPQCRYRNGDGVWLVFFSFFRNLSACAGRPAADGPIASSQRRWGVNATVDAAHLAMPVLSGWVRSRARPCESASAAALLARPCRLAGIGALRPGWMSSGKPIARCGLSATPAAKARRIMPLLLTLAGARWLYPCRSISPAG